MRIFFFGSAVSFSRPDVTCIPFKMIRFIYSKLAWKWLQRNERFFIVFHRQQACVFYSSGCFIALFGNVLYCKISTYSVRLRESSADFGSKTLHDIISKCTFLWRGWGIFRGFSWVIFSPLHAEGSKKIERKNDDTKEHNVINPKSCVFATHIWIARWW